MSEEVKKLTHIEHILQRPDSYVDSVLQSRCNIWCLDDEGKSFVQRELSYSPAVLKIFDEVLVNAIDRSSLYPSEVKHINVLVDKENGIISVENDGPLGGISVRVHQEEQVYNPELTFGHLLTSTNYNDNDERVVGGRNGYGAKLANIYSSLFVVNIKDGVEKKTYHQKWEKNMSVCNPAKIKEYKGKTSSVTITFVPDWSKFEMSGMSEDFFKLIEKRVYDAAICTAKNCKVTFQGNHINIPNLETYAKMFPIAGNGTIATLTTDRWSVVVAPSDNGFQHVSFVNGICTTKGGMHVEHVAGLISHGIIEEMGKKIKLQPFQVKSSMFLFVKSTLVNPSFSSQSKTECTLKVSKFGSSFCPTQAFIKSVLKTGIADELTELSKFREQKELKKTDGSSKKSRITGIPKLDDANWAGTAKSGQCTLIITEGDSAKSLAIAGLSIVGRDRYGVFPLRGKCKNVRDASVNQLLSNQEFSDLKKILGLQQEKVYNSLSDLRYGRLMIMTDADHDGSHIKGLIINMFDYFWPSLLQLGFVVSMVTPIIKATRGSQVMPFYTESAFREWNQANGSGWKIKYYKGLGTSTSAEAREYFKVIDRLTVQFTCDEKSNEAVVLAFDKARANQRKVWLLENTEKSEKEREVDYGSINSIKIQEFIHQDMVNFSLADLRRSIAHLCDGLKPSQRKVMHACFQRTWKDEMKVAQLAAYVSEKTCYHHGEVSLADTIVKLAQDFVGSNNINLLEPCGQFGTRLMGGKDSSQTRYIFTKPTPLSRKYFDSRDEPVLNYLTDDGKKIEPEYFVPLIPMVLVNGTEGIGTGFSSNVPCYNPDDILENIKLALSGKVLKPMKPWFKGFKGSIDETLMARGVATVRGTAVHVTELPPGKWTQDYKEFLDELLEKKKISNYKNNSTAENVDFVIEGFDTSGNLYKNLKLEKQIHTTNMHLFHPTKGIKKYESPEEILLDFLETRLQLYKKRKDYLVEEAKKKKVLVESKALFIEMVVEDQLVIFKKKRSDIESELVKIGFPKVDDSYDYLMNIKTYSYTDEAIRSLKEESKAVVEHLQKLLETSPKQMYIEDIS